MNTALAYRAGWSAVRRLPEGLVAKAFDAGAHRAAGRAGSGVTRLRENLSRLTGRTGAELDQLTDAGVRSYARYWLEVFRLPSMDPTDIAARHQMPGQEHIFEGMERGRGVILALPHSGNWDAAAVWLLQQGIPFTTVAERLKPEELFDAFVRFREGLGMEVLPAAGGARPPLEILEERLRAGRCLCLMSDRDMTTSGVPVRFAGGVTTMPAGPAVLARRTGAALIPIGMSFRGGPLDRDRGWLGDVRAPLAIPAGGDDIAAVAAITQSLADTFGEFVLDHPEDWHMLQRFWRDDVTPAVPAADIPPA